MLEKLMGIYIALLIYKHFGTILLVIVLWLLFRNKGNPT